MARKRLPVHWIFLVEALPRANARWSTALEFLHDGRYARGAAIVAEVWTQ